LREAEFKASLAQMGGERVGLAEFADARVLIARAAVVLAAGSAFRGGLGGRTSDRALNRLYWLLAAGLGLQVLVISIAPDGAHGPRAAIHLASYALIAGFVAANLPVPYLWLIALGGMLNLAAIAANDGVMPADPGALAAARIATDPQSFANSTAVADPALCCFGDILWVPASWPVSNVFGIGDVVIVVGAFLALHTIAGSRLPSGGSPRPAGHDRRGPARPDDGDGADGARRVPAALSRARRRGSRRPGCCGPERA
jgi:hypothetical protein